MLLHINKSIIIYKYSRMVIFTEIVDSYKIINDIIICFRIILFLLFFFLNIKGYIWFL